MTQDLLERLLILSDTGCGEDNGQVPACRRTYLQVWMGIDESKRVLPQTRVVRQQ
ncbi:MAG: hypothetical protein KC561_04460 [Myxococcales bacterium]|nr:hypothetical protein [Myxococcales bacterium]